MRERTTTLILPLEATRYPKTIEITSRVFRALERRLEASGTTFALNSVWETDRNPEKPTETDRKVPRQGFQSVDFKSKGQQTGSLAGSGVDLLTNQQGDL